MSAPAPVATRPGREELRLDDLVWTGNSMCETESLVTSIGKIQPYTKRVPRVLDPFRFVLIAMPGG